MHRRSPCRGLGTRQDGEREQRAPNTLPSIDIRKVDTQFPRKATGLQKIRCGLVAGIAPRSDEALDEEVVRIPLRTKDGSIRAYVTVDAADADWANQWRWYLNASGYAVRHTRTEERRTHEVRLHREILGLTDGDGLDGDHLDRNRLNCRRSNLRKVPRGRNQQNQSGHKVASSAYRGVSWHAQNGKWHARVRTLDRHHHIGYFTDELEAAEAARVARLRLLPYAVEDHRPNDNGSLSSH